MKLVGKEADEVGGCRNEVVAEAEEAIPKEADQASGGEAVNPTLDWPEQDEEWFNSMKKSAHRWITSESEKLPERRMKKVPEKLRCNDKFGKFFKPRVVSIGPYHFGSHFETDQVNKLKLIIAGEFSMFVEKEEDANFFKKFAEEIKGARDLYDKESIEHISEKQFTRMMFVDGCFIISFISFFLSSGLEEFGMTKDIIVSVQRDIFLLENQLPFKVLLALFCRDEDKDEFIRAIVMYFRYFTIGYHNRFHQEFGYTEIRSARPLHLLDLLRITWLGKEKVRGITEAIFSEIVWQKCFNHMQGSSLFKKVEQFFVKCPVFGFLLLMKTRVKSRRFGLPLQMTRHRFMKGRVVRSIKELITIGIYVKPNKSNLLSDIHFNHDVTGRLTLPQIIIDGSTKAIFLNMIAHEQCMNDDFRFTSYISFLDSLIDNADDVAEMRSAGVLKHFLNSDEEVAKLFNEIGADLVPESDIYMPVKMKIYNYLESKGRAMVATWVAEASRDHFRSPWTTIAVFAAIFVIALTVVQTYFAIYPRSNN